MSKVVQLSLEPSHTGLPDGIADAGEDATLVRDGLDMLAAFRTIKDEEVRRSLITVTRALAGQSEA